MEARVSADGRSVTIVVPMRFQRHGGRKQVTAPAGRVNWAKRDTSGNEALIRALAKAHRWNQLAENGTYGSLAELAEAQGVNASYLSRVLRLTLLAPDIVEAVLDGNAAELDLVRMMEPFPVAWVEQRAEFEAAQDRS